MKKVSILFAAAFAVVGLLVSWKAVNNSAVVIQDGGCWFSINGYSGTTDNGNFVATNSGNGIVSCQFSGVENNTGKAVVFNSKDFPGATCGTMAGPTDDWRIVISPSGQASFTCKLNGAGGH